MNLAELIEDLEQQAKTMGLDPAEIEVMAAHQPHYPIQESVRGVFSYQDTDGIYLYKFCCAECGRDIVDEDDEGRVNAFWSEEHDRYAVCSECNVRQGLSEEEHERNAKTVWIVLDGQVFDRSPYGDRRMWE